MAKPARVAQFKPPLSERPRRVNWDLYDFEGTSATKPPAFCWQNIHVRGGEFYQEYGETKRLRHSLDLVGSLREGWRVRRSSVLVETSLAEYQHPALQFGLTTPHREFWVLELASSLTRDRWEMTDRLRGLHLLVVEIDHVVGFVPLDEASVWHLALAYPLLGYLPPELPLELWAEATLHLDIPTIRRVREAWVEKHRRIIRRSQRMIRDAHAWVPHTKEEITLHGA